MRNGWPRQAALLAPGAHIFIQAGHDQQEVTPDDRLSVDWAAAPWSDRRRRVMGGHSDLPVTAGGAWREGD